jgi:hypothetical protein
MLKRRAPLLGGYLVQPRSVLLAAVLLPWTRFLEGPTQINLDVSWFYTVARGMMHGGVLYRDYIEPNAPLASVSLMPAVLLARLPALTPGLAVELYVTLITCATLVIVTRILRTWRIGGGAQLCCLFCLAVMLAFLPEASFGQREHIATILLCPYALLCVGRWAGRPASNTIGCISGLAAAFAIGLKPPLLLVPCFMEAAVLLHLGPRRSLNAQVLALAVGTIAIALWIAVFFPLYAEKIIPLALAIYGAYDQKLGILAWTAFCVPLAALGWGVLGIARQAELVAARWVLGAGFIGAFLAFVIQSKSWIYQLIPAYSLMLALLAAAAFAILQAPRDSRAGRLRLLLLPALVWGIYLVLCFPRNSVDQVTDLGKRQALETEIAHTPGPFVIFDTNASPAFPLALILGKTWASRYPCMLTLPAIVTDASGRTARHWEASYRAEIVADLRRYRPTLIMFPTGSTQALPAHFSIMTWLLKDPAFAAILAGYKEAAPADGFAVFHS